MLKLKISEVSDHWVYIPQEVIAKATHGIDVNIFDDEEGYIVVSVAPCVQDQHGSIVFVDDWTIIAMIKKEAEDENISKPEARREISEHETDR